MTQYDWLSQDINRIPFSTDVLWRKTTLKKRIRQTKVFIAENKNQKNYLNKRYRAN